MNILYICRDAGSARLPGFQQPWLMARCWARRGETVTLIAGMRGAGEKRGLGSLDGVPCHFLEERKPLFHFFHNTQGDFFGASLMHGAVPLAKQYQPDAVVLVADSSLAVFAACRLARKARCALILELPQRWTGTGRRAGKRLRSAYRRAAAAGALILTRAPVPSYLASSGLSRAKTAVIPLAVPTGPEQEMLGEKQAHWFARLRKGYKFLLICSFPGQESVDALSFAAAGKILEGSGIAIIAAAEKEQREKLSAAVCARRSANIYLTELPDPGKEAAFFAAGDALLCPAAVDSGMDEWTLRTFSMGKPVLLLCPQNLPPQLDTGLYTMARADLPVQLSRRILDLSLLSPSQRAAMEEKMQKYLAEEHDLKQTAERYRRLLIEESERRRRG